MSHVATAVLAAGSVDWCTPDEWIAHARAGLGGKIGLDPCANNIHKPVAEEQWTPPIDSLTKSWAPYKTVFVNPPYGVTHYLKSDRSKYLSAAAFRELPDEERSLYERRTILDWMKKCVETYERGAEVIALVPASVSSVWWHKTIWPKAHALYVPEGRIRFVDPTSGARNAPTIDTAFVYWGNARSRFADAFEDIGGRVVYL